MTAKRTPATTVKVVSLEENMDPSLTVVVLSVVEKKPTVISTTLPESRALPIGICQ